MAAVDPSFLQSSDRIVCYCFKLKIKEKLFNHNISKLYNSLPNNERCMSKNSLCIPIDMLVHLYVIYRGNIINWLSL